MRLDVTDAILKFSEALTQANHDFADNLKIELSGPAWEALMLEVCTYTTYDYCPRFPGPYSARAVGMYGPGGYIEIQGPPSKKELWPDVIWC